MSETDKIKDMIPNSNLTERQLEIILHWKNKNNIEIPNEKRKIKPKISKGSYYRILSQGKQNIKKSITTLIICIYLDLIDQNNLQDLTLLSNILIKKQKSHDVI